MRCPRCGGATRVVSTVSDDGVVWDYRHLKHAGFVARLEKYGNNWISRQRRCVVKHCGWTGTSIEMLEEP